MMARRPLFVCKGRRCLCSGWFSRTSGDRKLVAPFFCARSPRRRRGNIFTCVCFVVEYLFFRSGIDVGPEGFPAPTARQRLSKGPKLMEYYCQIIKFFPCNCPLNWYNLYIKVGLSKESFLKAYWTRA